MSRTARIALGYGAAMFLATFLVLVVLLPLLKVLDGRPEAAAIAPERLPEAVLAGLMIAGVMVLVPAALLALPVGGLIVWAERRGARGAWLHAAVGAGGGAAMALALGAGLGSSLPLALVEIAGFGLAGLAGAVAYWAISGRHAGRA